ncbi:MAG: glycosyltransferase [Deltaproteobacteria bacterium]|nr:glycosyltransferase [Deltaproteobacteria bacterium]
MDKRLIILHDYFESAEGGGRVSLMLAHELQADLGYGFKINNHPYFRDSSFSGKQYEVCSFTKLPIWKQFKLIRAFQNKTSFLKDYTLRVYSGFYSPFAAITNTEGRNILYCHTPPRFIYDQRDFYLSLIPIWQRPILPSFIRYFRHGYETAVNRMDTIIANSKNVQSRIKKYLGQDSRVIYPPCETDNFTWLGQDDYYLSTARIDPLKRVAVIVKAFLHMPDKKLIVTSGGSELARLKRMAQGADNIIFTGWVGENDFRKLIGKAIATIYIPRDEDFGMSPLESMAAGKPVIGVAEGGLLESVVDNETGIFIKANPSYEDVIQAIRELNPQRTKEMRGACERRAQEFRKEVFVEKMKRIIF